MNIDWKKLKYDEILQNVVTKKTNILDTFSQTALETFIIILANLWR